MSKVEPWQCVFIVTLLLGEVSDTLFNENGMMRRKKTMIYKLIFSIINGMMLNL